MSDHHAKHVCKDDPCSIPAPPSDAQDIFAYAMKQLDQAEAKSILAKADELVNGDRQQTYGHPLDNYEPAAEMMSVYLKARYGIKIALDFTDVVRFFQFAKMMREASPNSMGFEEGYKDNEMDVVGYSGVRELCIREAAKRATAAKLLIGGKA